MSYVFMCQQCGEGHSLEELTEVEVTEDTSRFECPDCENDLFSKIPKEIYKKHYE